MVAVEHPRADCGHAAALTQQCGRCLRWCCPECYAPWTALACDACRAEARAGAITGCRDRSRTRGMTGPHRHRERADVRSLAARVADLERRLQELRPGF
jgi:hypothetical protein